MTAAVAHLKDALLPKPPGGLGAGAVLAFLAHGALIAALALGVQWRASAPDAVAAELWAALPQVAAPRVEEPAPAPTAEPVVPPQTVQRAAEPDPQIAIEQEKRKQLERDKRAETARIDKERQAKVDKEQRDSREKRELAERKVAQDQLSKHREENLRRMLGQAGATTATGTAAQDAAPSRSYAGKLVAHIKPNIVFTDSITTSSAAEVEVRAAASGTIVSRRLVKSSGSKDWDEAVLRAIDRTGSLPRDTDGRVPSIIIVSFMPQE